MGWLQGGLADFRVWSTTDPGVAFKAVWVALTSSHLCLGVYNKWLMVSDG